MTYKNILAVSFGMGTNSGGLLCGFKEKGIVPDLILAANPGAEMEHSLSFLNLMNEKVMEWWGIEIVVVYPRFKGEIYTIEAHCLKTKMLPSIAYGFNKRSCSQKFKHQPMETFLKAYAKENGVTSITKVIGYGAEEAHRIRKAPESKQLNKNLIEHYWYPLAEWGWRRTDCMDAICRNGLPQPMKSACFFCPASKPSEVLNLAEKHPELMERALKIEAMAQGSHKKKIGLGGHGNLWSDWVNQDKQQMKLLDIEPMHRPCHCFDS